MQDLALAEGALPRHLHTAMFTQSSDGRMLTVRQLSRHLVGLWVTGHPTAMALLKRIMVCVQTEWIFVVQFTFIFYRQLSIFITNIFWDSFGAEGGGWSEVTDYNYDQIIHWKRGCAILYLVHKSLITEKWSCQLTTQNSEVPWCRKIWYFQTHPFKTCSFWARLWFRPHHR